MANPHAVVGWVERLIPPLDAPARRLGPRGRVVYFADGHCLAINPADPASEAIAHAIDSASRVKQPVYIEIDPGSGYLRRLLIPAVGRPARLRERDDGVEILLAASRARYLLKRAHTDFSDYRRLLRARDPLVVTYEDGGAIVDLRQFRPGPDGDLPPRRRNGIFALGWPRRPAFRRATRRGRGRHIAAGAAATIDFDWKR
ncbi:MAG: hypothetical protein ACKVS5_15745 [Parvularculaceae bacterium]